jgi:carbon-monoxide dehydrogenase medium subunit
MNEFKFQRATSVTNAADAFKAEGDARYLAGGQTLIPVLKQRLATPSGLVGLSGLAELTGIKIADGAVTIGAMTRHADVAASAEVQAAISALAGLAGGIGDPHVRNRGTIGGSVANNDPAADYPSAVLGLGATVHTDRRSIPAEDFFQGLFTTALDEGELITSLSFPIPEKAGYVKFPHPASRYCLVGVMVSRGVGGVRVAVTGAGQEGVFRVASLEEALSRDFSPDAISGIEIPADNLMTDMHAPANYRAHLIGVIARRAVERAIA